MMSRDGSLRALREAERKVVGVKQTKKALQEQRVVTVYVASDADPAVTEPVLNACEQHGTEVVTVDHMADLGEACRIDVGAAAAAVLKQGSSETV